SLTHIFSPCTSPTPTATHFPYTTLFRSHAKKTTMLETLEVRLALEKQAAQMASELRTHEDLAQMNTYIQKCKDAMNANEMEQFITSDIEFHKTIVRASGNQLLI